MKTIFQFSILILVILVIAGCIPYRNYNGMRPRDKIAVVQLEKEVNVTGVDDEIIREGGNIWNCPNYYMKLTPGSHTIEVNLGNSFLKVQDDFLAGHTYTIYSGWNGGSLWHPYIKDTTSEH
jgi:hypothetical protein